MSPSTSLPDDEQSSQPAEVSNSDIDDDEQKFEEEEEEEEDEIEELEGDDEQEDGVEEEVEDEEEEDDEVEEVEDEEEEEDENNVDEEDENNVDEEDENIVDEEDENNVEEEDENNVEEEDENNVEEEDEEVSDSPIEADDDHKDDGQEVKSERYDGQLESASSFPGNSKDLLSSALAAVESSSDFKLSGSSKELLVMKKEEIGVESGKHLAFSQNFESRELMVDKDNGTVLQKKLKPYSKQHSNRSPSGNSVIMDAKITNSSGLIGKEEVVDATMMSEVSGRGSHGLLYVEDENKQKEIQSRDDKKRKASSMDVSETGTRSLSSGVEIKGGNKSPAIICDFFLKGWCIKGSSCRFLHVKDHVNDIHPQCRGDVSDANCEKELHLGEGLKDTSEKSGSPSLHDPQSPPVGNRSGFSSDRIESQELMEGEASYNLLHQRKELHVGTSPAIKDVGRAREHQSWPTNDNSIPRLVSRGDSAFRNSLHPELSSSGHTISSSNYDTGNLYSHPGHDKDPESTQKQRVHDYPSSTLNRLLLPTWTSSQPFNYSKFNSCSLGSRSSSFLQSSSFSRPELDNLPSTSASLHYAELKPKVSNDWEPSVPFRPSFFIQSVIPSLGSQYDPLRDSFELPKLGDISTRASLFCHGSSIVNSSNPQMHGDSNTGTLGLAYNDDTNSVSSHNTYHEKTVPKEWNPSCLSDVEDIAKTGKINGYIDSRYHQDGSTFRNDMAREIKDMNVECDTDGGVQQESKALKHFRGALVELVKDLLKPKWREGQLSKDAHKKIVKKSVDKILSASEPNQVPSTEEALKQYLCSSHHKIVRLVEGYADKYGKT